MEVAIFLAPWIILGLGVLFVAFSGGPGRAREAYLTRANRTFRLVTLAIFVGAGIAVPAIVIADREEAVGGSGALASEQADEKLERGKELFLANCASCHSLAAVNARGVTGPNLDELGGVEPERVTTAIRIGGAGKGQMPPGPLDGEKAGAGAAYVSEGAGR